MEPTCLPPRALQPARFAPCLESDFPGLPLASRALGGKTGVTVPSTKSGTPDPRLPAPSSLRSLTLGYCAHHQSPVWRALFPQMQPAPPAPDSYPTPNALPGFAGPPWFLFLPPVSRLLFLLLSAPQLLANRFSTHPHLTFTTSPTTDPLSTGSQVVLSPE